MTNHILVDAEAFDKALDHSLSLPVAVNVGNRRDDKGAYDVLLCDDDWTETEAAELFMQTLDAFGVLITNDWLSREQVERYLAAHQDTPRRYVIAKQTDQLPDYLGFSARFIGGVIGDPSRLDIATLRFDGDSYRIIRVNEADVGWLTGRLASGLLLVGTETYASYEEAKSTAEALIARG